MVVVREAVSGDKCLGRCSLYLWHRPVQKHSITSNYSQETGKPQSSSRQCRYVITLQQNVSSKKHEQKKKRNAESQSHTHECTPLSYSSSGVLMADKICCHERQPVDKESRVQSRVQSCDCSAASTSFAFGHLNVLWFCCRRLHITQQQIPGQ